MDDPSRSSYLLVKIDGIATEGSVKRLGIIGGTGPESTIDYYRSIVGLYRERQPDGSYPPVLINSIDLKRVFDLVGGGELDRLADYLYLANNAA